MHVLLINPPLNTSYPADGAYPMGLGYIGAMLIKTQCEVDVLDIRLNKYNETKVIDFLKKKRGKYKLFGIGGMVTAYNYCKWLSRVIKKYYPSSVIIAGGSLCTASELLLRNTDIDIVCIGEGEAVITEIMSSLCKNEGFEKIPNICMKKGENIVYTKKELPLDINAIPLPAWDLFDMNQYSKNSYLVPVKTPSITMITERGCPFQCTFCYRNFGRKTRHRNIDNVINEIKTVIEKYHIGHIDFLDEIFNVNLAQVKALCKRIISEGIKVTWRCIGRTDLVEKETLQLMYEAGCRWIGYGIESGSQQMLDSMNKRQKIQNIEQSIRMSREAGLIVTGTFIIGMPGENEQTIQESRDFFKRNNIFNIPFFPVPYPGTILYQECKKRKLIADEEAYIAALDKDATDLVLNLTEMSDKRLKEVRSTLIKEFEPIIPSLEPSQQKEKAG